MDEQQRQKQAAEQWKNPGIIRLSDHQAFVPILRPQPKQTRAAVLLDAFVELRVHWTKEFGSVPCVQGCKICPHRTKYKWFAAACTPAGDYWKRALVELADSKIEAFEDYDTPRGLRVFITSPGKSQAWRVEIKGEVPAEQLPEPFDIWPVLERVFGMRLRPDDHTYLRLTGTDE